MKIIDDNIFTAIVKLRSELGGNNAEVGRKLGVSRNYIKRIFDHKAIYFKDNTWKNIEIVLRPYLVEIEKKESLHDDLFPKTNIEPLTDPISILMRQNWNKMNESQRKKLYFESERLLNLEGGTVQPGEPVETRRKAGFEGKHRNYHQMLHKVTVNV